VLIPDFSAYESSDPTGIEITLLHDFSSEALDGFMRLVEKFNDSNEWDIRVRAIGGSEKDRADLRIVSPSSAVSLLKTEQSIELSPLLYHPLWGIENRRRDFYRAARRQTDYWDFSRKIAAIPLSMNAELLLINNEILNEYGFSDFPGSWPIMNFLLWKVEKDGRYGGLGMDCSADSLVSIINARGGSILKPNGSSYSFNNPVVNRAIRYVRGAVEDSIIISNSSAYLNQTDFTFGKLLSVFTGADGIFYYDKLITAAHPDLDWSPALLPTRRLGGGLTVNCGRNAVITAETAETQLAAWIFIRWMASIDTQIELSLSTGSFPANSKAAERLIESPDETAAAVPHQWLDALILFHNGHMNLVPNLPDYQAVSVEFNKVIEAALSGDSIWIETWKLNRKVLKQRRDEREKKAGRR